jgi:RNA polymerase sigma-70 factor, ECF subfamily
MYGEHGPGVRTFVHRRIEPPSQTNVVAEVFLVAWRRYDEAPSDMLPWPFRIARGVLANRRHGKARRVAFYERLASSAGGDNREPGRKTLGGFAPVLHTCGSLSPGDQEILFVRRVGRA